MNFESMVRGVLAMAMGLVGSWAVAFAAPRPIEPLARTVLYDNTGNPDNTYYAGQGGAEAIDDLHLVSSGTLDTLTFEYYDPASGGPISATVTLYDNPGGLDLGTSPLAGPFTVAALPRGRNSVSVPLPRVATPGSSVWAGVRFTSTTAGWIVKSVPSVGTSHDLYLENGGFYFFGGNPKANFGVRLISASGTLDAGDLRAPAGVRLASAMPNPFRQRTALDFAIDRREHVRLEVLDVTGRRVRALVDEVREAGSFTERWSGRDDAGHVLGAGVYLVRLEVGATTATRRVVLLP